MITRMVIPNGETAHFLVEGISQTQVQLMSVVKLVIIPIRIEVLVLTLVPRQGIRTTQRQVVGTISGIGLQSIEQALAIHHQLIPLVGRRLHAYPTGILHQMARHLIVAFQGECPMAIGLRIDTSSQLIRAHRFEPLSRRHPIIRRQIQVAIGNLMHILSHLRK